VRLYSVHDLPELTLLATAGAAALIGSSLGQEKILQFVLINVMWHKVVGQNAARILRWKKLLFDLAEAAACWVSPVGDFLRQSRALFWTRGDSPLSPQKVSGRND
jgi:hypothetical protein